MPARKPIQALSYLIVIIGTVALCGCARPPAQPNIEQPLVPQKSEAVSSTPQPQEAPQFPPATLEEVLGAVKRVFKGAAVIDVSRKPNFLVGDFNGDLSQDLAVILNPAEGKLSELNQEFPSWIAREPLEEVLLPKSKLLAHSNAKPLPNPAAGQTVRFEQSDVLLAIIHGSGPKGWHDPDATQTHLLRHVVGANMRTLPIKAAVKAYKGVKPFPTIYGDLIQQTLIGQSGFLHFTGGIYGWYDPRNYKPVALPMPGHVGMSTITAKSKSTNPNSIGIR
ncbi:MAG: hypothetical protein WAU45_01610 [Blastocatellia bacterium]